MKFSKSFILPYFDYCLSLSAYFLRATLQKLCTCFYASLFRLFKFDFTNFDVTGINEFLKNYGLFAFKLRVVMRLSLLTFKVIIYEAPIILYGIISASDLDKDSKIGLTNEKRVLSLRSREKIISVNAISKFSRISFDIVFNKAKERGLPPNFDVNIQKFKTYVFN